jgi:hypothetical protein
MGGQSALLSALPFPWFSLRPSASSASLRLQ